MDYPPKENGAGRIALIAVLLILAAGLGAGEELDGLTYQALYKKAGIRP